jgi:hypothetical protein
MCIDDNDIISSFFRQLDGTTCGRHGNTTWQRDASIGNVRGTGRALGRRDQDLRQSRLMRGGASSYHQTTRGVHRIVGLSKFCRKFCSTGVPTPQPPVQKQVHRHFPSQATTGFVAFLVNRDLHLVLPFGADPAQHVMVYTYLAPRGSFFGSVFFVCDTASSSFYFSRHSTPMQEQDRHTGHKGQTS